MWDHQKAGKEESVFWGKTVGEVPVLYGGAKNPKKQKGGVIGMVVAEKNSRASGHPPTERHEKIIVNRTREYTSTFCPMGERVNEER